MIVDLKNNLPESWVKSSIGFICTKPQYGWTTSAVKEGQIRLLRTTDISKKQINWSTVPFCAVLPENVDQYLLKDGDIVVSRAGSVGFSYLLSIVPFNVIFASYLIRFRPYSVIDGKYVSYYLQSPLYWESIGQLSAGIAVQNVNASKLSSIELPIAPLPEQHRIVEEIEKQFSRLDDGVANLRRIQANLKRYRASVLQSACSGRLVPTEADLARNEGRDYEPAGELLKRILVERRRKWEENELTKMREKGKEPSDDKWKSKYQEPSAPDTSDLPELPEGWVWTTAEVIADIIDPQPSHRTPPEIPNGIPYVGMGDIGKQGRFDIDNARRVSPTVMEEHNSRYHLQLGDFIIGKIGTIGKPFQLLPPFDYTLSANVVLIQPNHDWIHPSFTFTYMASPFVENMLLKGSRATTQAAFGIQKVRLLVVPLPPLTEQQRIVEEVERRLSVIEQMEAVVEASLKRAERLRQSILKRAFEGKLVSQDPNDEPASALLERIRAERASAEKKPVGKKRV